MGIMTTDKEERNYQAFMNESAFQVAVYLIIGMKTDSKKSNTEKILQAVI